MPQFSVPQFIEMEPRVVGPFTLKQFLFLGTAGAICFFLYFTIGKKNFFLFLLLALILIMAALSLAILKIGGQSLPTILKNFFYFTIAPKIYLWRKKEVPPKVIKRAERKAEAEIGPTSTLKFAEKSHLKKLSTQIETKTR